jgi:hypothetical protein
MHYQDWVQKNGYYELIGHLDLRTSPVFKLITFPTSQGKWRPLVKDYYTNKIIATGSDAGDLFQAKSEVVRLARAVLKGSLKYDTYLDYRGRMVKSV